MKAKLNPKVFRDAAGLIAAGSEKYACHAIAAALGVSAFHRRATPYLEAFAEVYKPEDRALSWPWWDESLRKNRESRVWALLIMAEIVAKGGHRS